MRAKPVPGATPKLDGKALDRLYRTITLSNPQRFKFEFALWTRAMVRELIRKQFNVALSEVSAKVRKFVEGLEGKLRLFRLPAYSPDLNPDEHVWAHLKGHKMGRRIINGPDQVKKLAIRFLRSLQKNA